MTSLREQLMWLKTNTVRTGVIHEAQAVQLRNYPLLLPHSVVGTGKAVVDTDRKLVEFSVEVKPLRQSKMFKNICKNIEQWTRTLLWNDTVITIKANDKIVYDSRNVSE